MKVLTNYYLVIALFGFGLASYCSVYIPFGSGYYTIAYRVLVILLSFFLIIAYMRNIKQINIYMIMVFLFLFFYAIRLSIDSVNFDFGMSRDDLYLRFLSFVIIPFFTLSLIKINIRIEWISFYLLTFILILSILSMPALSSSERLSGNEILNPITLGYYASFLLITVAYLFFKTVVSFKLQILLFFCGLLAFFVLLSTLSRGPMVSLVGLALFEIFFSKRQRKSWMFFVSLFFAFCFWLYIAFFNEISLARLSINLGESNSDGEVRVLLWNLAIDKIIHSPIIGSNVTTNFGYVHNVYLEAIMATGFVGAFFLILPLGVFLSKFKRSIKSNTPAPIIYYYLFFCIIAYFFSGTIYSASFLFTLIPAAFQYNQSRRFI